MKNHGLDLMKEHFDKRDTDWEHLGGSITPCKISIPTHLRDTFLPKGELQYGKEDYMSCASYSPTNLLESKFTYAYTKGLLKPENALWLENNGYVVDGRIVFSNRFIAIQSGTTRRGNSLKAPCDTIHRHGMIPKALLPDTNDMTFDEYHDASKITRKMKRLGKEFLKRFTINYERVFISDYAEILENDLIDVAGHAWPKPVNGVYPRVEASYNHAFLVYNLPKYQAYDSYLDNNKEGDYVKTLASDYKLMSYAYRLYVSEEKTPRNWFVELIHSFISLWK